MPDFEDRQLVGKAMGLNEMQIAELAKLPKGVAVVYQNDWLNSVLVQMPYCRFDEKPYSLFDSELWRLNSSTCVRPRSMLQPRRLKIGKRKI